MSVFHNKCSHSRMLINRFFKLLSIHCHETRDVKFYAEQLSITPTYLYKIVGKYLSQSPKELIDKRHHFRNQESVNKLGYAYKVYRIYIAF